LELIARRTAGSGPPIEVVFSPALPLGARVSGHAVIVQTTPGDVHATVRGMAGTGAADLSVAYAGGWSIVPPETSPAIGERSTAPRVLSERLSPDQKRYSVAIEGIAGRAYRFRLRAPDAVAARRLIATIDAGGQAVVTDAGRGATERSVLVTFPMGSANSDGYLTATVTFAGP
jgi:hypothetical protein